MKPFYIQTKHISSNKKCLLRRSEESIVCPIFNNPVLSQYTRLCRNHLDTSYISASLIRTFLLSNQNLRKQTVRINEML